MQESAQVNFDNFLFEFQLTFFHNQVSCFETCVQWLEKVHFLSLRFVIMPISFRNMFVGAVNK